MASDQASTVAPRVHLVRATHDYETPGKGFLSLNADDLLYVIEADPSGWWLGANAKGQKGVFPSTYTVPAVFPLPGEYILTEVRVLRCAELFHVNMTSGSPTWSTGPTPTEVSEVEIAEPATVDDLYTQLDAQIVKREVARTKLVSSLKELEKVTNSCMERSSAGGALVRNHHRDLTVANRALGQHLRKLLAKAIEEHRVPHHSWFCHLSSTEDESSARHAELSATKRAVSLLEGKLSAVSSSVKAKEASYLERKEILSQRIRARDDSIMQILSNWARRADAALREYRDAQARNASCLDAATIEAEALSTLAQNKRNAYDQVETLLVKQRARARAIKSVLLQKKELDELEVRLQELNKALLSLRNARRQKSGIEHHA